VLSYYVTNLVEEYPELVSVGVAWLPEFGLPLSSHPADVAESLELASRALPGPEQLSSLRRLTSWCEWARYLKAVDALSPDERLALMRCFRGSGFEGSCPQDELLQQLTGVDWYYKLATELATESREPGVFLESRFLGVVSRHLDQAN